MNWLLFLAAILAVYVASLMVSKLSGPARIFAKLRNLPPPKSATREGLQCPICSGTWIAAAVVGYLWHLGAVDSAQWPVWWLAVTGGSSLIHLLDKK